MSLRAVIILNPAGGGGRAGRTRTELERLLSAATVRCPLDRPHYRHSRRDPSQTPASGSDASPDALVDWEIVETTGPGSATEIAANAVASGAQIVVAAGGDGTLNEVLNGVVGTQAVLALIPLGTGNDFARTVGLHGNLPLAVDTLVRGEARLTDAGCVAGRWFLNVAGCGFDAAVADRANRGPRWLGGAAAYVVAVIATIAHFRAAAFRLTLDGESRDVRAMLCSIANARTYGGGMRIAPDARLDDGLFDICVLAEAGIAEFLLAFPRVFRGTHTTHPKVTMLRARRVRIESDPPLPLLVDGEVIGTTPAEFTLVPGAVRFLFPVP